jgi:DNA repair protein RadA/Sms
MTVKSKMAYSCTACGALQGKWAGQCGDCEAWNTLTEIVASSSSRSAQTSMGARRSGYAAAVDNTICSLSEVTRAQEVRIGTGLSELDRVLGGGLVEGAVVLIGGDPGIGKSTLLLQTLAAISQDSPTLYVTGEESLHQVKWRAERLQLPTAKLRLLTETRVESIIHLASQEKPSVMVIDSIQTIYTEVLSSAPGSVSQVRESAAQLVRFAKQTGTTIFLVGHVTKEGALAGPRVLEHMVDTVLYFEGESDQRFRVIRAVKNRFGAVNELGIFAMNELGLKEVSNPSAIFLSRYHQATPGSVVMVSWEGSRPMLVEVQALVDDSHLASPRRVTVGLEQSRLALGLAVLSRHAGIATYNQDIFVNIVGGVRVSETAADLAMLMAVLSSFKAKVFPRECVVFGEVGLAGEIRPVQSGQERLREAVKHGFKKAIIPAMNKPKHTPPDIELITVQTLDQAVDCMFRN